MKNLTIEEKNNIDNYLRDCNNFGLIQQLDDNYHEVVYNTFSYKYYELINAFKQFFQDIKLAIKGLF